ncbi:MAG: hypothetical protein WBE26_11730 [Phycisphaerae bacterium]
MLGSRVPINRLFPWWGALLLDLTLLAGVMSGAVYVPRQAVTVRWERYAAELLATGEPLTFKEIERMRAKIPDERNGALVIEKLRPHLEVIAVAPTDGVLIFDDNLTVADFFVGIPRHAIESSRAFVVEHSDILRDLSSLHDKPTGRLSLCYDRLDGNPLEIRLPSLTPWRNAAKLEHLDVTLRLIDGDSEAAAVAVRLQFHIAASLNEEPTLMARLVQIAVDRLAVRSLESILRVGQVQDETLLDLASDVKARLLSSSMHAAFTCERASFIILCDQLATGQLSLSSVTGKRRDGVARLPPEDVREEQIHGVQMYTWLVEAKDDPKAMLAASTRIDKELHKLARNITRKPNLIGKLIPSFRRAVELHVAAEAELQCALVALGAERFRLRTGRFPESVARLVPDYLDEAASDPFDGKRIEYATIDDGIVVYVIGENEKDDGGSVAPTVQNDHPKDVGFRLFRAERRGLLVKDYRRPGRE